MPYSPNKTSKVQVENKRNDNFIENEISAAGMWKGCGSQLGLSKDWGFLDGKTSDGVVSSRNNETAEADNLYPEQKKDEISQHFDEPSRKITTNTFVQPLLQNKQQSVETLINVFQRMTEVLRIKAYLGSFMESYNKNIKILQLVTADSKWIAGMSEEEEFEYFKGIYDCPLFFKDGLEIE